MCVCVCVWVCVCVCGVCVCVRVFVREREIGVVRIDKGTNRFSGFILILSYWSPCVALATPNKCQKCFLKIVCWFITRPVLNNFRDLCKLKRLDRKWTVDQSYSKFESILIFVVLWLLEYNSFCHHKIDYIHVFLSCHLLRYISCIFINLCTNSA